MNVGNNLGGIYRCLLVDLPHGIRGFARKNYDCRYTILITAGLNSEMQVQTCDHEIRHINDGDYDRIPEVDRLEYKRHIG